MPVLTPDALKKKQQGLNYPAPPMSTSAAPTPQPPAFAPPPPSTGTDYGVDGPPQAGGAPQSPPQTPPRVAFPTDAFGNGQPGTPPKVSFPTNMFGLGGKTAGGVPATSPPGMTTSAKSPMVENPYGPGSKTTPIGPGGPKYAYYGNSPEASTPGNPSAPAATPGSGPFGDDASYLNHVRGTIDSTISDDQWMAWKKDLDQGCPGNKPFRTSRPGPGGAFSGPERCVEKPDNCPDGFQVVGNDQAGNAKCIPGGQGAPGGGLPGGPGGSGSGAPGYRTNTGYGVPGAGGMQGMSDQLQEIIQGNLRGQNSRYSPEAVAALLSQSKATAEDQSIASRDAINEDAAARGVLGAGTTGTALSNARATANRQVAGDQSAIAREKITADYQDKQQAIQNAQTFLDQARDWMYKQQMTQMQREQFEANLALAYARMQQEWDQLQYSTGMGML